MLNECEQQAVRDRISDFVEMFTDAILDGDQQNALSVMEGFYGFFCGALEAAQRDGRRQVLDLSTN